MDATREMKVERTEVGRTSSTKIAGQGWMESSGGRHCYKIWTTGEQVSRVVYEWCVLYGAHLHIL